jgi:hypothetical protein
VEWVRHGNRGQTRPWRISERIRGKVLKLAGGKYAGFKDSHLTEKLQELEGAKLSWETVRRILPGAGQLPCIFAAALGAGVVCRPSRLVLLGHKQNNLM